MSSVKTGAEKVTVYLRRCKRISDSTSYIFCSSWMKFVTVQGDLRVVTPIVCDVCENRRNEGRTFTTIPGVSLLHQGVHDFQFC